MEAIPAAGEPWPGEARATFEWHDSGAHVVGRSTVDIPGVPNNDVDHGMRRGERHLPPALRVK